MAKRDTSFGFPDQSLVAPPPVAAAAAENARLFWKALVVALQVTLEFLFLLLVVPLLFSFLCVMCSFVLFSIVVVVFVFFVFIFFSLSIVVE